MIDYRHRPLWERARPWLDTRNNEIHTLIVYEQAKKLLAACPRADEAIVLPAAILHDVGWKMVPESEQLKAFGPNLSKPELQRLHEVEGARIATEIRTELHFAPERIAEITAIIDGHDTRADSLSIHDDVVRDADRLFRFTPTGLRIDLERFGADPAQYVPWLATKVDEWLVTDEARRLARKYLDER